VTKWIYQASTGLFTQKQDATLNGAIYTYDELGFNPLGPSFDPRLFEKRSSSPNN
jgi:hypothetical protein